MPPAPLVELLPLVPPDGVPPSPQATGRNARTSDIPAVARRIRAGLRAPGVFIERLTLAAPKGRSARFAQRSAASE